MAVRFSIRGMVHVQAEHFAQESLEVLSVALGILLWTGVAHAQIEKTIGPKLDAAAAMILGDANDFEQAARRKASRD